MAQNVLGTPLETCCMEPLTGFYRTGQCDTGPGDHGVHTVCAEMTEEFLAFSKAEGNDLSTPMPLHGFDGLKPGDKWCLCAPRWKDALDAGMAPRVCLEGTHAQTLEWIDLADLQAHALNKSDDD